MIESDPYFHKMSSVEKRLDFKFHGENYLLFADIMGFRNLVSQNSHEYVKSKIEKLQEILNVLIDDKEGIMQFLSGGQVEKVNRDDCPLVFVQFSDSLVVLPRKYNFESLELLCRFAELLIYVAAKELIPLRGLILKDKLNFDLKRNLISGQAVYRALKLERNLLCYGISIEPRIYDELLKAGWGEEYTYRTCNVKTRNGLQPLAMIPICNGYLLEEEGVIPEYTELVASHISPEEVYENCIDIWGRFYSITDAKYRIYVDNTIHYTKGYFNSLFKID